jgi:hypothetical protein
LASTDGGQSDQDYQQLANDRKWKTHQYLLVPSCLRLASPIGHPEQSQWVKQLYRFSLFRSMKAKDSSFVA